MTDNFEYPSGILIPGTKYKVIRRLGAGGMGTVYEVEDTNIEKRYVLKTLHASLSSRADLAERMRREARALARLEHRNIVQVITADVTADSLRLTYLVMEKLNGHTLRTVLDNKTRLNVDTACRLSIDLLNALYHAHENRIIHRDVKPENIFLHRDADGTTVTKLLDFGIMTEAADAEANSQTGHNRFIGTLRYAAPEQLSGRPITAQTDIYAAGLCLYEIITGYGPFDDLNSTSEIAHAHLQTIAPPISKHVRVARQLEDIVRRALAKDPADRQHDAFTFAAELNRFRKSQQGALELAPLSQVETVNDPFHLSTDPGVQQRMGISGSAFSRPAIGGGGGGDAGSPPPAGPPIVSSGAPPYPSAQSAQALQHSLQPQAQRVAVAAAAAEGGSGVRASNHGVDEYPQPAFVVTPSQGSHGSPAFPSQPHSPPPGFGSSDPMRPRSSSLADAATEFDEGDGSGVNAFSAPLGSGPGVLRPPLVRNERAAETHENASPAPMTLGGPTPVPAAGLHPQHDPHPRGWAMPGAQGPQGIIDRNAPTGTYAPPGVPDVQRSGTAIMSSVDGPPYAEGGDPATAMSAQARTMTAPQQRVDPAHAPSPAHAPQQRLDPALQPETAKRSAGAVIWIVIAGSAIGAALAIGGIYQLSHKPADTASKVTTPVPSPSPPPVVTPPEPAKPTSTAENLAAAVVDAGVGASNAPDASVQPPPADKEKDKDRHRPRPQPTGSGKKKLPGSGLD